MQQLGASKRAYGSQSRWFESYVMLSFPWFKTASGESAHDLTESNGFCAEHGLAIVICTFWQLVHGCPPFPGQPNSRKEMKAW
jgi:hypothetical protein